MSESRRTVLDLQERGVPEVPELGVYRYAAAQSALPPHRHRGCYEFCYLAAGRQNYRVDGCDHALRGGDVFFTHPDEVHDTGGQPEERGRLYWLILAAPRAGSWLGLTSAAAREWTQRLESVPTRVAWSGADLEQSWEAVFAAAAAAQRQTDRDGAGALATARIRLRLAELVLSMTDALVQPRARRAGARLERVLAWSEARLDRAVSVADWARVARLSESRFKAWFREEMGLAPTAYRQRRRIEVAQQLLRKPRVRVTAVAHELGFSSSQHFATVFKRHTGRSPRGWSSGA